jgi:hypothetical protein
MNLLTDSGTVLAFTALQAIPTNPNYPGTILPLDTFENRSYDDDHYEAFFDHLLARSSIMRLNLSLLYATIAPHT